MRHPEWILAIVLISALLAPMACAAQEVAADYAQRDAEAVGLEDFAGGHSGVVLAIVLIAAVVVLVALILPW